MERQQPEKRWPAKYDANLQMFVEEPREPNIGRLRFLRWMVEQRRIEHPPAGPSSGPLALADAILSNNPIPELPEPDNAPRIPQD